MPRFTIEHDLCPLASLRANFFLVLTDSENVVICGSGSGSEAISLSTSLISDLNPLNSLPLGPSI